MLATYKAGSSRCRLRQEAAARWTFDSTAAPTTYAFDQLTYSILDQENIARGHLAYYLQWTNQALKEAGDAYVGQGITTIGQLKLSAAAQRRRGNAIAAMQQAQTKFAGFDFVNALKLAPGTTEIEHGTRVSGAASCPSAAPTN